MHVGKMNGAKSLVPKGLGRYRGRGCGASLRVEIKWLPSDYQLGAPMKKNVFYSGNLGDACP